MAYLGKTPSQAVRSRFYFTASGGETSLAPAQVTGLSFTDANYVDVSLNGVALVSGTDYTATPSTNTISSLAALTASDVVEIVVYDVFSVFGGNVNGDFTISNGTLAAEAVTVTGLTTTGNINFGDNDKANFGALNDMQIYHNGSASIIQDVGSGDLFLAGDNNVTITNSDFSENKAKFISNGGAVLYYNNNSTVTVTSTGIDVTGTVTADGLTVDSTGGATPTYSHTNNGEGLTLRYNDDSGARAADIVAIGNNPAGATTAMRFFVNPNSTDAASEVMRIQNGNVGIGKSSSITDRLHIEKSGANCLLSVARTSDGAAGRLVMQHTNAVGALQTTGSVPLTFGTADTERMRINSSGNVGIGVVPETFNTVDGAVQVGTRQTLTSFSNDVGIGYNHYYNSGWKYTNADVARRFSSTSTVPFIWQYAASGSADAAITWSEAMRIDSIGRMIFATGGSVIQSAKISANYDSNSGPGICLQDTTPQNGNTFIRFINAGTTAGQITSNGGSSTTYATSSDQRLKENVVDMTGAIDRVKALAPKRFNFISDADTTVDGFLAHEAQAVVPEAVTGTHNEVDDDGNAVMQGIDQSKLVPLLTGALREAIAKIETLETQRVDLEARLTALENA